MSSHDTILGPHRLTVELGSQGSSPWDSTDTPITADSAIVWGDLVADHHRYIKEKSDKYLVFIKKGPQDGEITWSKYSHRFTEEYTKMQYAKIQSFVRGALNEYDDPHFVFLTRSTSTLQDNGDPRPPIDHLNELMTAWDRGVRYELDAVMNADRKKDEYPSIPKDSWEYLRILEPTTEKGWGPSGYAHEHTGLVVDGDPGESRFHKVIMKHVEKSPNATLDAHEFDDSIEVRPASELNNPGAYLFKYLGKSWEIDEITEYEQRFNALLFSTGRRRLQPSMGAGRWMKLPEEDTEANYIFAGVATSDQITELVEYEDLEDFEIDEERGIRSWLNNERITKFDWEIDEEIDREKESMSEEQFAGRIGAGMQMPWEYTDL